MAFITVSEISRLDLQELETAASASITDVKPLSSYNWIEAPDKMPTIAVPGSPALWSAPAVSRRLNKDSGLIYIAQNAARHPDSPLEPLFRALYITHPSFDIRSTDVVTDRNNIRKLLAFINPGYTRDGLEAFTMNIEVTKNTAIFCRDEAKTVEHIGPQEFRGFGHEFEKAYTLTQISGSTGHHRIISYCFGGLNFIIRHETDGYVDAGTRTSSPEGLKHTQHSLSSLLGALSLSSDNSPLSIAPTRSKLVIKQEGKVVPLESTLEIKTRVSHRSLEIQEVAPQLWVSQTPKLVRAYHQNGTFQKPVVEDVTAAIKSWEEREQNDLRKLAALIRKIIHLVTKCGGNAVLKYDVGGDKLVIYKVERKHMLPNDLYAKWDELHDLETKAAIQNDGIQGPKTPQMRQESTVMVSDIRKQSQPWR